MLKLRDKIKMVKCTYCHGTEDLSVDHKISLIQGGTDDVRNLQCLCSRCNGNKGGMSHAEVRRIWKWGLQVMVEKDLNKRIRAKEKRG